MELFRKTTQTLAPIDKPAAPEGKYDIYPVHELGEGCISADYASLARALSDRRRAVIDGYTGVFFDILRDNLTREFKALGIEVLWWNVDAALKSEAEIQALVDPFLGGDDPIFGTRTTLALGELFDASRLAAIRPDPAARLNILYGSGAALAGWDDAALLYVDLPKNELQFRARAMRPTNLGVSRALPPKVAYKRFYFVDRILLDKHKKALLPRIDILIDGQRPEQITWTLGDDLRRGLSEMSQNFFRVRPWFEPGAWGGQWMKHNIEGLSSEAENYAWSFELIVPENGLLFSSSGHMLEVSFDTLMFHAGSDVVGQATYRTYGDEFPIRMDYLDNKQGGNLSIQCHPRREYCRKNFGEVLTQEETYYIMNCWNDAVVYLGFQDDIDPARFEQALTESHRDNTPLDVARHINSVRAEKHGLYLIPPGTLHSSGRNNLVLEISTTPYIFTFKMYDWLALDLDGKPRPLNIRRAMENLDFSRKGKVVEEQLVSHPALLEKGEGYALYHLPTHADHSYDVHRFHITGSAEATTDGKCHVLNLVEGSQVEITTRCGMSYTLHYAETLVIPAAAEGYRITNKAGDEAMVIKAFMK